MSRFNSTFCSRVSDWSGRSALSKFCSGIQQEQQQQELQEQKASKEQEDEEELLNFRHREFLTHYFRALDRSQQKRVGSNS